MKQFDSVLATPRYSIFSLVVIAGWTVYGLLSVFLFFICGDDCSSFLIMHPDIMEPISSAIIAIGAVMMIISNFCRRGVQLAWVVDHVGILLATSGWAAQAIGILSSIHLENIVAAIFVFVFTLASGIRLILSREYGVFVESQVKRKWKTGSPLNL